MIKVGKLGVNEKSLKILNPRKHREDSSPLFRLARLIGFHDTINERIVTEEKRSLQRKEN